jgi:archaellum component FlaG (FlaF/FlaG flagellin family)
MKGISAFIATVLVIAFTVGVGTLLGPWIYSTVQNQAKNVGQQSETRTDCEYGGVQIVADSVKCNFSGNPDFLNFTLKNTGNINLYNFTCEIKLNDIIYEYGVNNSISNTTFTSDAPLRPGQSKTVAINITNNLASANPDWVRIRVPRCPTVDSKVTGISCS